MKAKLLLLLLLLLSLVGLQGCLSPDGTAEELYLTAESEVSLARGGEDKLLTVETNASQWSFVSAQEGQWLSLEKDDNHLHITASENLSAEPRTAVVLLAAGTLQREVLLTQAPADVQISFFGSHDGVVELNGLSAKGEERTVGFYANSQDVEVEVSEGADWLVVKDKNENGLILEAKENTQRLARSGTLVLRAGKVSQTLRVSQDGQLYYLLPIMAREVSLNQMFTREKQRGSTVTYLPTDRTNQNLYRLKPASPIADLVQYQYDTPNQKYYNEAFVHYTDRTAVIDNAEFDAFMAQMGFPNKALDPTKQFTQYTPSTEVETQLIAQVLDFGETGGAAVLLSEGSQQTQAQPTFDVLPLLEEMEWLGGEPLLNENKSKILREPIAGRLKMGYIYDEEDPKYGQYKPGGIFDREMQKKSDFDKARFEADPDVQWYTFLRRDDSPIAKLEYSLVTDVDYEGIFQDGYAPYSSSHKYNHLLDDAWRIMAYTDNRHFSKIFYETRSLNVGLTREFIALMERNGFQHTAEEEGFYFFFNKAKLLSFTVAEVDNYQVLFDIQRNNRANLLEGAELLALQQRNPAAAARQRAARKAYIELLRRRITPKRHRS